MIHLEFENQRQRELHTHKNYEVLCVMSGTCELVLEDEVLCLKARDFIIINTGQHHAYKVDGQSLIGRFHIPYSHVMDEHDDEGKTIVFLLNSQICEKKLALEKVRRNLYKMVDCAYKSNDFNDLELRRYYHGFLEALLEGFAYIQHEQPGADTDAQADKRICEIMEYFNHNYNKNVSLNDLASRLFLSSAYLSKYIKQQLGMNFIDLLNKTRLDHASEALVNSEDSIAQIALDVGFTNLASFNRSFKEKYGRTPSNYRKLFKGRLDSGSEPEAGGSPGESVPTDNEAGGVGAGEMMRTAGESMRASGKTMRTTGETMRTAGETMRTAGETMRTAGEALQQSRQPEERVNGNDSVIYEEVIVEEHRYSGINAMSRFWNRTINIGAAEELLHSDVQSHVLELKNHLHFRYVRFWDIYSPGLYLSEHREGQIYNFSRLDRVLDFLVENHLVPHMEVANKPKKLMRETRDNLLSPRKGDSPFKSSDMIRYFFSALMRHLIRRYGANELDKWVFEYWLEEEEVDDIEWRKYEKSTLDVYLENFNVLAETIRRFGTSLKVGGAGLSLRYGREGFEYMIRQWRAAQQQPSFLSLYVYPYELDGADISINYRVIRNNYLQSTLTYARSVLAREQMSVRLVVSEWNMTVFNRNLMNDSVYKGAWLIKNFFDCIGIADMIAYWVGSDLYAESYDMSGFISGNCGLITRDGIKKPAWYAFGFMNALEKFIYIKSDHTIVTRGKYKDWKIVCHNYKDLNLRYYMQAEDSITVEDIETLFDDRRSLRLYFELPAMDGDIYRVKILRINRENGSVQDEWLKMSRPDYLDADDVMFLKNRCMPGVTIRTYKEKENKVAFSTLLEANEIQFISLECLGQGL